MTYRGNFSKHPIAPETGSPAYTRTRLAQSSDLELKPQQATLLVCLSWDALCVPQAVGVKERSSQYLIYLFIISNSQPRNKFLHIEKTKKNLKYQNKNIYIYIFPLCEWLTSTPFLLLVYHLFFCWIFAVALVWCLGIKFHE